MQRSLFLLFVSLALLAFPIRLNAQNALKKVSFSVTDAVTGKPVEGAEIKFKALIGKIVKKTNSEGKATFDMFMVVALKTQDWNYTVTYPNDPGSYKTYSGTLTLLANQDDYSNNVAIQPDVRKFTVKIADSKKQPLANATVKLKNENGVELISKSNATGMADFSLAPNASFNNATITVVREGSADYAVPVEVSGATNQVAVIVPVTSAAAADVIITDNTPSSPPKKTEPVGLTGTGIQSSLPPGYAPKITLITWGPYIPECDLDPLSDVPEFKPFAVPDEETLLDAMSSSCIESASGAVNALVSATEQIVNLNAKIQAQWTWLGQNKMEALQGSAKVYDDLKKVADEEGQKTKESLKDAVEKTKDLLETIKNLGEGPELLVLGCMWDGMKSFAIPDEITKIKKGADAFGKGKKAMADKLDSLKARVASGSYSMKDISLFTDWSEVKKNVEKSSEGLNIILSYINDPKKVLPYETQANLAFSQAESLAGTLVSTCQIRECDRQLKQGVEAAQAALTASRKHQAQMLKAEDKWRQRVNDYVAKVFPPENRGWEYFPENDFRREQLPKAEYNSWAKYHNDAYNDGITSKRLEDLLEKFSALCQKIRPIADVLNDRVRKYEDIYNSGITAVANCKLDEAETDMRQMRKLESSDCGHFFPRPNGEPESDNLDRLIGIAKESGDCVPAKGDFVLKRVVDHSGWPNEVTYNFHNPDTKMPAQGDFTFTLETQPPPFIDLGTKFTLYISAKCNVKDPVSNSDINVAWSVDTAVYKARLGKEDFGGGGGGKVMVGKHEKDIIRSARDTFNIFVPDNILEDRLVLNLNRTETGSGIGSGSNWKQFIYERRKKGKGDGEVSEKKFQEITGIPPKYGVYKLVEDGIKPNGIAVIGKFPDYVNVAKEQNGSMFVIGDKWDQLKNDGYDPWNANRYFLSRIADMGQRVLVETGHKPLDGYTEKEVKYLKEERGYIWSPDHNYMVPGKTK